MYIAEGSLASATSKETELKLANVARASLGELLLDYEDFLRQRGAPDSHEALAVRKITGFGSFIVNKKNSRKGRNPQTGEPITISARKILTFKPSPVLKGTINLLANDYYLRLVLCSRSRQTGCNPIYKE